MSALLRPNLVTIVRIGAGTPDAGGDRAPVPRMLNANVPALIDFARAGHFQFEVEGKTYTQDAEMFIDGLRPIQFIGKAPGQTITVNGIMYTVAVNGLCALPDIRQDDRVTDESGNTYLVLAVAQYYTILPSVEVRLSKGRG